MKNLNLSFMYWVGQKFHLGFSVSPYVVKNLPVNAGDAGWIPVLGSSPGGGNGNPLQYSFLENSMDRGAWWATVHGWQGVRHSWALTHTHLWKNPKEHFEQPNTSTSCQLRSQWTTNSATFVLHKACPKGSNQYKCLGQKSEVPPGLTGLLRMMVMITENHHHLLGSCSLEGILISSWASPFQ